MKRLLLILLILRIPAALSAQDAEGRKARLQKEIAVLENRLKTTEKKNSDALTTLKLTRRKISSRKALLQENEREIRALGDSIRLVRREVGKLQARLDTMSLYYSRLVKNAYKNRDSKIWYMYILSSGSLSQGYRRYSYLKGLAGRMSEEAERLTAARTQLEERKAVLEKMEGKARALRAEGNAELKRLRAEETSSQKTVKQLNANKKKYQKQLRTKRKQIEDLNRQIERMIDAAKAPNDGQKTATGKKSREVDVKLSSEFAANRGKLPWPVTGVIVDSFGEHYHPVYKSVKMPFNNGVGIATKPGSQVKVVFGGVVRQKIVMPGYNECVLIQHGEYFTFYCKMTGIRVKAGEKVSTGQVIGRVADNGSDTQLHFQLWKGRKPLNPENWLY